MTFYRKARPSSVFRTLVLTLFVLGMVLQPVVVSMSEIHAFSHDPSGHQALAEHLRIPASGSDQDDGSGTSRVLHHFAHCCAQSAAMVPAAFVMSVPLVTSGALALGDTQTRTDTRTRAPFRPPITG